MCDVGHPRRAKSAVNTEVKGLVLLTGGHLDASRRTMGDGVGRSLSCDSSVLARSVAIGFEEPPASRMAFALMSDPRPLSGGMS